MNNLDLGNMKKMTPRSLETGIISFWNRFFKLVVVMLFIGFAGWGGYLWYFNVYHSQWSEEEKKAFLTSQSKEIKLEKELLEKVIQKTDAGREKFGQEVFSGKNIFKEY